MAEQVTFREIIAYRPLVVAWVWEIACTLGGVAVMLTTGSFPAFMGLLLAGGLPFLVVLWMFVQARKRGELGPRPRGIVE